jgi:hypothetical protein
MVLEVFAMEISGVSTPAAAPLAAQNKDPAVEMQKAVRELAEKQTNELISSIPDPDSSLGQNIDVKA